MAKFWTTALLLEKIVGLEGSGFRVQSFVHWCPKVLWQLQSGKEDKHEHKRT